MLASVLYIFTLNLSLISISFVLSSGFLMFKYSTSTEKLSSKSGYFSSATMMSYTIVNFYRLMFFVLVFEIIGKDSCNCQQ